MRSYKKVLALLGDLIHRIPAGHAERSPFPLRGEGKGDLISQLR